jgi:hypothetical protein
MNIENYIELNRESNQFELREKINAADIVAALRSGGEPESSTLKALGNLARNRKQGISIESE